MLRECGMGLIGQTAEIAPADKKIYALRDATGTVENVGLICASIMSKKLAEGIDVLVLDVKTGSGAFMKTERASSCWSARWRTWSCWWWAPSRNRPTWPCWR